MRVQRLAGGLFLAAETNDLPPFGIEASRLHTIAAMPALLFASRGEGAPQSVAGLVRRHHRDPVRGNGGGAQQSRVLEGGFVLAKPQ